MPTTLPPSVREHFGEQTAEAFSEWLDEYVQENAVERDEYRKVLSRLDVIDERFEQVDQRFEQIDRRFEQVDQRFDRLETRMDERFGNMEARMDERFESMEERFDSRLVDLREEFNDRFESMDAKLDRMNDRILSMTRWLIGLVALFGSLVTALLAVAQFG